MYPFQEKIIDGRLIREFSADVNSEELVWHRDRENREVTIQEGTGWQIQIDNNLPIFMIPGNTYKIPKNTYHRIIKGRGSLVVEIKKPESKMKITRRQLRQIIRETVLAEQPGEDRTTVRWETAALGSPISTLDVEESRITDLSDDAGTETENTRGYPECCTSTLKLYAAGSDQGLITPEAGLSLLNIMVRNLRPEMNTFQGIDRFEIDPSKEDPIRVEYENDHLKYPGNLRLQKSKIASLLPSLEEQLISFLENSVGAYRRVRSPGRLRRHKLNLALTIVIDHQPDAQGDGF
jgi:hypothetical protein